MSLYTICKQQLFLKKVWKRHKSHLFHFDCSIKYSYQLNCTCFYSLVNRCSPTQCVRKRWNVVKVLRVNERIDWVLVSGKTLLRSVRKSRRIWDFPFDMNRYNWYQYQHNYLQFYTKYYNNNENTTGKLWKL